MEHNVHMAILSTTPDQIDGWNCNAYYVRLERNGRALEVKYSQGLGCEHPPTVDDVLCSVLRDADSASYCVTFEDWCSELNYNSDSRKAEATYKLCCAFDAYLKSVFTAAELADLRDFYSER